MYIHCLNRICSVNSIWKKEIILRLLLLDRYRTEWSVIEWDSIYLRKLDECKFIRQCLQAFMLSLRVASNNVQYKLLENVCNRKKTSNILRNDMYTSCKNYYF